MDGTASEGCKVEAERTVPIKIPMGELDGSAYVSNHLDMHLDGAHAQTLRRVFSALNGSHARLKSGRVVQNAADVVRWMLEQVNVEKSKHLNGIARWVIICT